MLYVSWSLEYRCVRDAFSPLLGVLFKISTNHCCEHSQYRTYKPTFVIELFGWSKFRMAVSTWSHNSNFWIFENPHSKCTPLLYLINIEPPLYQTDQVFVQNRDSPNVFFFESMISKGCGSIRPKRLSLHPGRMNHPYRISTVAIWHIFCWKTAKFRFTESWNLLI